MEKHVNIEERNKIFTQLWSVANALRGSMDASEFKNYALGMLFIKCISHRVEQAIEKEKDEHKTYWQFYDELSDEDKHDFAHDIKTEVGIFLKPDELFTHLRTLSTDKNKHSAMVTQLVALINSINTSITQHKTGFSSGNLLEDFDIESTKLGSDPSDRHARIATIIEQFSDTSLDALLYDSHLLGDAYEYLIGQFASSAGKKGGEFYTPRMVSQLLAHIVSHGENTITSTGNTIRLYDPTCGSASLLLQAHESIHEKYPTLRIIVNGQEKNRTTFNLARMNMMLHNIDLEYFTLHEGDVLQKPLHRDENSNQLEQFDRIVANPPFSQEWTPPQDTASDERFRGYSKLAPKQKADFAFIQHMLYSLKENGIMAVVAPHGVLFRGGGEKEIRTHIIKKLNCLDTIINLPSNLFYGTSIPTVVMVFHKCRIHDDSILFIDASREFEAGKNQNHLRMSDIERILAAYQKRETQDKYSALVPISVIEKNEYNLNISRYVQTLDEEEILDEKQTIAEFARATEHTAQCIHDLREKMKQIGL